MKTNNTTNEVIGKNSHASNEEVEDLLTNFEMVEIKGGKVALSMDCHKCSVTCVRKANNNHPVSAK